MRLQKLARELQRAAHVNMQPETEMRSGTIAVQARIRRASAIAPALALAALVANLSSSPALADATGHHLGLHARAANVAHNSQLADPQVGTTPVSERTAKATPPPTLHARSHVLPSPKPTPAIREVIITHDPSRYGINRYAAPAYIGAGRIATAVRVAPWEPYVDGGSIVASPVYTLAPSPVVSPPAPTVRRVYRSYHLHHRWTAPLY